MGVTRWGENSVTVPELAARCSREFVWRATEFAIKCSGKFGWGATEFAIKCSRKFG